MQKILSPYRIGSFLPGSDEPTFWPALLGNPVLQARTMSSLFRQHLGNYVRMGRAKNAARGFAYSQKHALRFHPLRHGMGLRLLVRNP